MSSRSQRVAAALVVVASASCSRATKEAREERAEPASSARADGAESTAARGITPNDFLARGAPTFVLGTAGDDRADHAIAAQAGLVHGLFFASSPVVTDESIDAAKGPGGWPKNPVVYGGPHVNKLLSALGPTLPFEMRAGRLVLGADVFEGDGYLLVTVVPARAPDAKGPGYPEFLLFAGTGTPGVAEINAPLVSTGAEALVVADAFGRLAGGDWKKTPTGERVPVLLARAPRIAWRAVERKLEGAGGRNRAAMRIFFPQRLAPAPDEEASIAACMRGVATVVAKLSLVDPAPMDFYVYPDPASKLSLTGSAGSGNAVVASRALHVLRVDPAPGGALESLVAHEATHVLAYEAWGAAGTPLMGEGLAVWVSGSYAGVALEAWRARITKRAPIADLLGAAFRRMPEGETYPAAGLLVDAAVKAVGLENVRDHLLGATSATWDAACKRAGTTPARLEELFQKAFAK